jgi:Ca-activated chloride channel family protein
MLSFANNWVLWLLVLIPILIWLYLKKPNQTSLKLSPSEASVMKASLRDAIGYHLPFILRIICLCLIIILLARPQLGRSVTESKNYGLDIFLAVDTSQSMSALDLEWQHKRVDRLTVLRHILKAFVEKRTNDRLGVLVFGEEAFTQCPLTMDHGAILDLIDDLEIGMVGNATAIGSAIAVGVKRLKELEAKSKILILMTDGQNTAGSISPEIATELAKELNIKIYTIGIGQDGEVPFIVDTPAGPIKVNQEVEIDEELLTKIADETGGLYYRARSTNDLQKIYENIDKLEKTEAKVNQYNSFLDIYEKFLWPAFFFFVVEVVLVGTILFRL